QRRQRLSQAHRSHAFQRAARRLGGHRQVSLAVLAINLLWLTPIAVLVAFERLEGLLGLTIALLPLWLLAVGLGAGSADD
ncbi:MAG: glycosyl transferase, partial [Cyanobacteria bacterium]|nr:glycosyl transferase [Cyanobacteriota bacterium]